MDVMLHLAFGCSLEKCCLRTSILAGLAACLIAAGSAGDGLAAGNTGPASPAPGRDGMPFYVGTYTGEGGAEGIYAATLLPDGRLDGLRLAARSVNPSFLALHPSGRFLYAANEVGEFEGRRTGFISAFRIEADGGLTPLNQAASGGEGPCHLAVDPGGSLLAVANYGGGSVAVLRIRDDGSLGPQSNVYPHQGSGPNSRRQEAPHAHCVNFDPFRPLLLAADLGIDQVRVYVPDPAGVTLKPGQPEALLLPPGSGPRHLDFSPDGRFVYVVNELTSTVSVFARTRENFHTPVQTVSTLPAGTTIQNHTAEIQASPDGRTVYASNRGHDTIAVLRVSDPSGTLELVQNHPVGGSTPRSFALAPGGHWLVAAAQRSDLLTVHRVDPETGRLASTGASVAVPRPVCVLFVPAQR
ncbi:MAG: lactonase family protein [Acidobacteriota bacterium]